MCLRRMSNQGRQNATRARLPKQNNQHDRRVCKSAWRRATCVRAQVIKMMDIRVAVMTSGLRRGNDESRFREAGGKLVERGGR